LLKGLAIICFILLVIPLRSLGQLYRLERNALEEFSEDRNKGETRFFQFVSNTTNTVSLGVPFSLLVAGMVTSNKGMRKNALYITESMALSTVTTMILKNSIRRQRPFAVDSLITKAGSGGGYSFPSGHTSQAFSIATSLIIAYPKWYVVVPAYLWAGTVSYSRMYLGVHYPSDIIAGAIVGAGSAWLAFKANQWMKPKNKPAGNITAFLY
jgi:membrane-associated phospholipid phosphatase